MIGDRLRGRVAFVTGAARGQGRSHAVRLAEEGADILAVDCVKQVPGVPYPLATPEDLQETADLVRKLDHRIVTVTADVRDQHSLDSAIEQGLAELGAIDIVCANAGVGQTGSPTWEMSDETWHTQLDINLSGVFHTVKAAVPSMISGGRGGSIILTGSSTSIKARQNIAGYVAAKHGVTGLMRTLAIELAPYSIRVNSVNPCAVPTDMLLSDRLFSLFRPDLDSPTVDDCIDMFRAMNALPTPWVEARDVSNAVLWLASDEARFVTGMALSVDAGSVII